MIGHVKSIIQIRTFGYVIDKSQLRSLTIAVDFARVRSVRKIFYVRIFRSRCQYFDVIGVREKKRPLLSFSSEYKYTFSERIQAYEKLSASAGARTDGYSPETIKYNSGSNADKINFFMLSIIKIQKREFLTDWRGL